MRHEYARRCRCADASEAASPCAVLYHYAACARKAYHGSNR